jgi:hypothetical protein
MTAVAQPFRAAVTAIGFRIKSGYAIAIVLAGPAASPTVVARRIVELSDPAVAETKQPYHDGFGTEHEDPREIARRVKIIERCAMQSVTDLIEDIRNATTSTPRRAAATTRSAKASAERSDLRAGLVVGSVIDPQQVGNPHIRAHANEGKLFRTVVENALASHGIACDVIVEKQLAAKATAGLRRSGGEIKQTLAALGKTIGGPWRAEEKAAATAAWLALGMRRAPR